jgi:hypothetical protein
VLTNGIDLGAVKSTPLDALTQAKFIESLKSRFRVSLSASETHELELVEVTPAAATGPAGHGTAQYESFSLIFQGPEGRLLPQKLYSFTHAELGTFELFIVPIGKEMGRFRYQAVFNRRIRTA